METLKDELLRELKKITDPLGVQIVELQANRGRGGITIAVVIEKGGSVSIDDCERITNLFNARMETLELLSGENYSLQVSSPGTSRVFKSRNEYEIFLTRKVRVVLKEPFDDTRRTNVLDGVLEGIEGESVTLNVAGEKLSIPFSKISKTHLHE